VRVRVRVVQMVQWFADDPKQPFSLHRIAHAGLKYGKNVGEWFGPSTMAQVLEYATLSIPFLFRSFEMLLLSFDYYFLF
jgi:hypothetical protein